MRSSSLCRRARSATTLSHMSRPRFGHWTFLVVAVVLAAVFVRLGMWQLDRLDERRQANRIVEVRMKQPARDLAAAMREPDATADGLAWQSFHARGTWDFGHEIVIRGRANHGTPGVHVITPLMLEPDRAVLVLRGWLPAADGLSADLAGGRPADTDSEVDLLGLAVLPDPLSRIPPRKLRFAGSEHLVLGSYSIEQASEFVPYGLAPILLLATGELEDTAPGVPAPLDAPRPSDGPHLWYALQWFGFAIISLSGAALYVRTRRRSISPGLEGGGS